ncbi:MAG: ABC transporter ATP-binding protein [Rhodospirillales bacterium]|nr:ABC transporter ATP-binding protein [Rhodospirillales bacterium]
MTAEVLVRLAGAGVRYSAGLPAAIAGVSLSLARGERLAVIGESGSGKTTLALAMAGLLPAGSTVEGRIEWPAFGGAPKPGRDVGYVFQDPSGSLDPVMRVGDQLAEVAAAHGDADPHVNAVELIAQVELPDPVRTARAYPHELSGGQRQRIALALALAGRPSMLIADEATSALDPVVQKKLAELVVRLCRTNGLTLVFVTHDIALAAGLGTRIAVVYSARLAETGPAERVLSDPAHPYTKALLESHLGRDVPRGARVHAIEGQPPDPALALPGCRFALRCRHAVATCNRSEPGWAGARDDGAACILPAGMLR